MKQLRIRIPPILIGTLVAVWILVVGVVTTEATHPGIGSLLFALNTFFIAGWVIKRSLKEQRRFERLRKNRKKRIHKRAGNSL